MSEQLYDFFGEIFQRYFRPAMDAYPRMGGALVERLLTLTDDVPDRLAQTRRAAMAWGKAETPNARITSELFVITQHGYSMSTWRCGWICPRSYFFAGVFLAGVSPSVCRGRSAAPSTLASSLASRSDRSSVSSSSCGCSSVVNGSPPSNFAWISSCSCSR
jgi:hypothetical protein